MKKKGLIDNIADLLPGKNSSLKLWGVRIVGGVALIGLTVWGIGKISSTISEHRERKKSEIRRKEAAKEAESKLKHDLAWFDNATEQLKNAVQTSKGYNAWFTSYDKDRIIAVLSGLKNKYEWTYLITTFGNIKSHNLLEWLGCDDSGDIDKYNSILDNLGVDEIDRITNNSIFAGTETQEIILL